MVAAGDCGESGVVADLVCVVEYCAAAVVDMVAWRMCV